MPGVFLGFYPDEIFYSGIQRYASLVNYPSAGGVSRDLFGVRHVKVALDLPGRLQTFVERLHVNCGMGVDGIIANHTQMPFYGPFMAPEQAIKVVNDMKVAVTATAHVRSGVTASTVKFPEFFAVCPMCVESDLEVYGEAYWHRLPQNPGVMICPTHDVFTIPTSVTRRYLFGRYDLFGVPVEEVMQAPITPVTSRLDHRFRHLARDVQWLLNNNVPSPPKGWLQTKYLSLLYEKGLASYKGRVDLAELRAELVRFFDEGFLTSLQCQLGPGDDWLCRLLHSRYHAHHPVRHLLLSQFLGLTAETLFGPCNEKKPYGDGPWPCLNRVCSLFQERVISDVIVTIGDDGQPVGTFRCSHCGFTYSRHGFDQSDQDAFTKTRVKQFGWAWKNKLLELSTSEMGLREMARTLGADPNTITKYLNSYNQSGTNNYATTDRSSGCICSTERENYRILWRDNQVVNPSISRSQLRKLLPGVYMWLRRNDRMWLEENSPAGLSPKPHQRVNWHKRDHEISLRVADVAQEILSISTYPRRLTKSNLARGLGVESTLLKHPDIVPQTVDCVNALCETRCQFACRRIGLALKGRKAAGPQKWRLIRAAGLRKELLADPSVAVTVEQALQVFNHPVSFQNKMMQVGVATAPKALTDLSKSCEIDIDLPKEELM